MWSKLIAILVVAAAPAHAATINAASTAKSDVESAVASAANGDTVVIPSGDSTWTTTFYLTNKALRLTGAGVGNTIIRDGVAGDFWVIWLQPGYVTEVDNIELRDNGGAASDRITIEGLNTDNRHINWHSCKFDQLNGPVFLTETARGVIHYNTFVGKGLYASVIVAHTKDSYYDGAFRVRTFGNRSYAADNYFGSTNFIFFENNLVTNSQRAAAMDGQAGSRYVYRWNTNYNVSIETHGSEAGERSGRAFEIYNNYFRGDGLNSTPIFMRGGVTLCYSNTFTNWASPGAALSLLDNRTSEALFPPFGGATGVNPWDSNNVTVFASGTVTGTNGYTTITNSGASMTAGQWTNYTLLATSGKTVTSLTRSGGTATATVTSHGFTNTQVVAIWGADQYAYNHVFRVTVVDANTFTFTMPYTPASPATGTIKCRSGNRFSRVLENTATTIRYYDSVYEPYSPYGLRFEVGDTYEIRLVEISMDQAGVWGGVDFGTSEMPTLVDNFAGTQTASPNYEWANTHNGGNIDWQRSGAFGTLLAIIPGRHFTNDAAPSGFQPLTFPHPLASTNAVAAVDRAVYPKRGAAGAVGRTF